MLRIVQCGNSLPASFICDPSAEFQPGQCAELTVIGNQVMCTVSDGTAPIGIIDDIRTKAFTNISWNEVIIVPATAVPSSNPPISSVDIKAELRKPNIVGGSFVCHNNLHLQNRTLPPDTIVKDKIIFESTNKKTSFKQYHLDEEYIYMYNPDSINEPPTFERMFGFNMKSRIVVPKEIEETTIEYIMLLHEIEYKWHKIKQYNFLSKLQKQGIENKLLFICQKIFKYLKAYFNNVFEEYILEHIGPEMYKLFRDNDFCDDDWILITTHLNKEFGTLACPIIDMLINIDVEKNKIEQVDIGKIENIVSCVSLTLNFIHHSGNMFVDYGNLISPTELKHISNLSVKKWDEELELEFQGI